MIKVSDYPLLVFVISLVVLSLSVPIGANVLRRLLKWEEDKREDFGIILGATLTLLALIVGFSCRSRSFSIADIDSPRGGIIHVQPENLLSLVASLRAH